MQTKGLVMPLDYVLVTPARNEETFIEGLLKSVVAQTARPKRWIIVSDGSTDRTEDIVRQHLPGRDWIELLSLPGSRPRDFSSKVQVFCEGFARLRGLSFDIIGNVDADITFEPAYFEYLLGQFERDRRLGVAGTHYIEGDFHSFRDSFMNPVHVNGGCQLFRRECFEEIGGYKPIAGGGVDWVAVTTARMKGWSTRSFGDKVFFHHRRIGTAGANEVISRFRYGKKDYFLGAHPVWQLLRGTYQVTKRPYLIGGLALIAGYVSGWASGAPRPVSEELMRFYRSEQLGRLKDLTMSRAWWRRAG